MKFDDLDEEKVLRYHLNLETSIDEKTTVFSTLILLLKDCRTITQRDLITGARDKLNDKSHNWLGAIGYLTVLDQIGKCYGVNEKSLPQSNSIIKALLSFTTLKNEEAQAIYALRCSFAHDYSLFNINNQKKGLTHHFTVTGHGFKRLIGLPKKVWDGNVANKAIENMTFINIPLLTDLVEDIVNSIQPLFLSNQLQFLMTPSEIKNRYLVFESRTPHGS